MDADSYAKGTRVTVTRRVFAWLIDWAILNVVSFIVVIAVRLLTQQTVRDFSGDYWYFALEVLLYFVLLAYLAKGQTIGKNSYESKSCKKAVSVSAWGFIETLWFVLSDLCQHQSGQYLFRTVS